MYKTGVMDLMLHYGSVPRWLLNRMIKLAEGIFTLIIDEFGVKEVLNRLSDKYPSFARRFAASKPPKPAPIIAALIPQPVWLPVGNKLCKACIQYIYLCQSQLYPAHRLQILYKRFYKTHIRRNCPLLLSSLFI